VSGYLDNSDIQDTRLIGSTLSLSNNGASIDLYEKAHLCTAGFSPAIYDLRNRHQTVFETRKIIME